MRSSLDKITPLDFGKEIFYWDNIFSVVDNLGEPWLLEFANIFASQNAQAGCERVKSCSHVATVSSWTSFEKYHKSLT